MTKTDAMKAKDNTRAAWLESRRAGIGGTDWADILNVEPYGCARRCWYDKTGTPADYPEEVSGAMRRGNKLEPMVFAEFEELHGRTLWKPKAGNASVQFEEAWGLAKKIGKKPRPSWWIGTPDAVMLPIEGEPKPSIFEAKTVGPWAFMKIVKEGIPERTLAQRQHYLGSSGWRSGVVAYLEPVEWKLFTAPYERDASMLSMMLDVGERFWRKNVIEGKEPERLDPTDSRCKSCRFFPTCQGALVWEGVEQEAEGDYTPSDDEEIAKAVRQRIEIAEVKKDAEKILDEINEAIRSKLGAGNKILTADGHKLATGTGVYNRKDERAFAAKYPRLAARIKERFTVPKPGTIQVNVYPKKGE